MAKLNFDKMKSITGFVGELQNFVTEIKEKAQPWYIAFFVVLGVTFVYAVYKLSQ